MQKIAILYDASQAVLSTLDLDEVLKQILALVRDYFQVHRAAILLLDNPRKELYVRASSGWDEGTERMRTPLGTGLTGAAARMKRPVYAADVCKDSRYVQYAASTKSQVAIPLMLRDEVVGVLDCQSDRVNFFDSETIDLLTLFSQQASLALQNAHLYSLERKRATQLQAINAIAQQTTAVMEIDNLLEQVCSLILQFFPCDHVSLLLLEGDRLSLRAQKGKLTSCFALGESVAKNAGLAGTCLVRGKAVVESDIRNAPDYVPGIVETISEMCLPLISFGQTIGVLALDSASANAFGEADLQPLESVADICANAIQNARHFAGVKQLAYLDGVTGVFNRRHFELRISDEIHRAERYGSTFSIIMIDIDHFKRINDEFGHLLGDEVLRQVSNILAQQVRKSDIVCRYGGEEFAIIVPETIAANAAKLAEKLRATVAAWYFPGVPRPVTISAGVAAAHEHGLTRDQIVKTADEALYAAKQAGRNSVMLAGTMRPATASL